MKALVVCKTSILELQGDYVRDKVKRGLLDKGHLSRLEKAHGEHLKAYENLFQVLSELDVEYSLQPRGEPWPDLDGYSGVITVGGDGTVLEASHHLSGSNVPLLGIRSSSMSVGHLCLVGADETREAVLGWLDGKLLFHQVSRLIAKVTDLKNDKVLSTDPILNDFLYTNLNPAETTRYTLELGGVCEAHKSSGIWVATAAGSTAAIQAAGGEVCDIADRNFQFLVRELYREPGTDWKLERGKFDPESTSFFIENRCEQALLALDGQHGSIPLGFGDRIEFLRSSELPLAKAIAS